LENDEAELITFRDLNRLLEPELIHPERERRFNFIDDQNWCDFSDTLRSQKAMQTILSQFNKIRNVVAHSCALNEDEIMRFKLFVKDWFRIQS